MFQEAIRAFKFMPDVNNLPAVSTSCSHKVDSIVLSLSRFTAAESEYLTSIIGESDSQEFELRNLQGLSLISIMTAAKGSFSRALIIWALLKRLIEYHTRNCGTSNPHTSDYVDVSEFQSLDRDMSISELDLSVRSRNALTREGIHSLIQLSKIPISQLMSMQNLGIRSVNEIVALLENMGFHPSESAVSEPMSFLTNDISLEKLDLSTRTYNALKRIKIDNLIQLSSLSESDLRDIRNLGRGSINEVKEVIARYDLSEILNGVERKVIVDEGSENLYEWAKSKMQDEIDKLAIDLSGYESLKVDYQTTSDSNASQTKQLLYFRCNSLTEVHEKLRRQIASAKNQASIEILILNLDSFKRDFTAYKEYCSNDVPSKDQKYSLLKYENDYSDESIDLLKFDDFTLQLLGLEANDNSVFLGKESFFELLGSLEEYFVIDKNVWDLVRGVVRFHEKYKTYPNTLGLIIAHHLGDQEEKKEVHKELTYLFETLRPNSADRDLMILQMRMDGATLDEIGKQVSVTRERVRQILMKISPELIATIEVLKSGVNQKQEVVLENRFESIFNKYGAVYKSELAEEIGLAEHEALKLTPKRFSKYIIDKFPEPTSNLAWSREDCLKALRRAATYYFPIRQADYDHLINIGEVKGPSVAYMYLKYGQWSELCLEAGVEFFTSVRSDYKRMWSEEELLSYARRFFVEPDTSGSYGSYDVWRERQTDHVPSGVLIRNVFGSWTTVKRKVLESLRQEKGLEVRNDI